MNELEQRQMVITEALTWLNTPYHLNAKIKGVGVDCGTLLMACFENTGLIEPASLGTFTPDFHLHRGDEVYINWLKKYCHPVKEASSGDIIVYRFGRIFAHGALVIEWPKMIHCYLHRGVIFGDATDTALQGRKAEIWSFWGN